MIADQTLYILILKQFCRYYMQAHFLNILSSSQHKDQTIQPSKTIKLQKQFLFSQQLNDYPLDLQNLYHQIFNQNNMELKMSNLLPFKHQPTQMPVCNKTFQSSENLYRCYDCLIHPDAVYCIDCFDTGQHQGHRFEKFGTAGGNCDCGNPEAIKPSAFCSKHPGKPVSIDIDQKQKWIFHYLVGTLFDWYILLAAVSRSDSEQYGIILSDYLISLNDNSLYYNALTSQMLFEHGKKSQQKIISKLFQVKTAIVAEKFSKLFFQIFSLQDFKYQLFVEFIKAYNSIPFFQVSKFSQLYVQLTANTNLILKILETQNLVLDPSNRLYDEKEYFNHIRLINELGGDAPIKFFSILFKKKFFQLQFMRKNILQFENTPNQKIVQLFNEILRNEYAYEDLIQKSFRMIRNNKEVYQKVLKDLYDHLKLNKQIYVRNTIILPYHRTFALCLFIFNEFCIERLHSSQISAIVKTSEEQLMETMLRLAEVILSCLWQFSLTFVRSCAFDHYLCIYLQGISNFKYDALLIRIIAFLASQTNKTLSLIIIRFLRGKQQQAQDSTEFHKRVNSFISILTEIAASDRPQLLITKYQSGGINQHYNTRIEQILSSFLSHYKQPTLQNTNLFIKYFLGHSHSHYLPTIATFNQSDKKFIPKNPTKSKINFGYYPTLKKLSQKFIRLEPQDLQIKPIQISKVSLMIVSSIYSQQLVSQLMDIQSQCLNEKGICQDWFKEMVKIDYLYQTSNQHIHALVQQLQIRYPHLIHASSLAYLFADLPNTNLPPNSQSLKLTANKAKLQKMNILKERQKKVKASMVQKQMINEEQVQCIDKCLVCKEDDQQKTLCFIGRVNKTNNIHRLRGSDEDSIRFSSCMHFIHMQCLFDIFGSKEHFKCPLCSALSNVYIPISNKQSLYSSTITNVFDRINVMNVLYTPQHKADQIQAQRHDEDTFIDILDSFVEDVGFRATVKLEHFLNSKVYFYHQLYQLAKTFFEMKSQESKLAIQLKATCYLANLRKHQTSNNPHTLICQFIFNSFWKHCSKKTAQIAIQQQLLLETIRQQKLQVLLNFYGQIISKIINTEHKITLPAFNYKLTWEPLTKCFYQIPQSVIQLLQVRDSNINDRSTKCICCLCGWIGVLDKKYAMEHTQNSHCFKGLFINLMLGEIYCVYKGLSMNEGIIYENQFGQKWTPKMKLQGYYLNKEKYQKLILMYEDSTIQDYIANNLINHIDNHLNHFATF